MKYNVQHNIAEKRFEIIVDNLISIVDYSIEPNGSLKITHTEVPKQLEGKGIAASLTKAILNYARDCSLKVRPICPYTKAYIERKPEYKELVE